MLRLGWMPLYSTSLDRIGYFGIRWFPELSFMSLEHCPFMATVRWWLRDVVMGLPQLFVEVVTGQGLFEGDP